MLSDPEARGYAQASEPRPFSFPADHGPHPAYRNEWWYVTGNLDAREGRRFGFELTLFRFALAPPAAPGDASPTASAWRTRQIYVAHFAVTDAAGRQFRFAERYARGALGLAGATSEPFRVWVEDWWLKAFPDTREGAGDAWLLHASTDEFAVTLTLEPQKPPVLNGVQGLSQKSAEPGNASYYYSLPRLAARGTVRIANDVHDVSGLAWVDREWGSSALADDQQGWDWFALQLADGSELMFYRLRREDGSTDAMSAGTWIPARGDSVPLTADDVTLTARDSWESPRGGRYPVTWTLAVPRLDLELRIDPVLRDQELATSVRYWEGAVDVTGRRGDAGIEGRGYVELTGYARPE
ncbi:MAG TPA: lipocalin-like domain-containing protein [Woeseiaceae bacterium]